MNTFRITDATNTIDFLSLVEDGARLISWKPKIIQPKGGGVFQNSPMAPGRRRVYSQPSNSIEVLTFSIEESCLNDVFGTGSDLINLLDFAVAYWETDFQNTPVYLEVDTENGNAQYAIVKSYTWQEIDNPFAQPMYSQYNSLLNEVSLEIERGDWLELPPGDSEQISMNIVNTESNEVFVANKYSTTQLTHIYVDDGGVFGANLVASTSFDLLPASPAINDAVYFGNDDPFTFYNLSVDFATVFAGTTVGGVWEIYNGGWVDIAGLTSYDATNELSELGINNVSWSNTSMTTFLVNSITAYWIRFRVTSATGVTSIPSQQNRIIYQSTSPYLDITGSNVIGDTSALAKLLLRKSSSVSGTGATEAYFLGLRSLSRGEDFNAYINTSSNQVPSGIIITLGANASYSSGAGVSPTDEVIRGLVAFQDVEELSFTIDMDNSLSQQYIGRFRAFILIRADSGGSGNDDAHYVRLAVSNDDDTLEFFSSNQIQLNLSDIRYKRYDFGTIVVPNLEGIFNLRLKIYLERKDTSAHVPLFASLILMPTDEVAITASGGEPSVTNDRYVDIDSVSNPKNPITTTIKNNADDSLYYIMDSTANSPMSLQNSTNQRVWITTIQDLSDDNQYSFDDLHKAELYKNERYKIFRGSR